MSTEYHDPEIKVTRSLLEAACAELRKYALPAGADDQVLLNLEATIAASKQNKHWAADLPAGDVLGVFGSN